MSDKNNGADYEVGYGKPPKKNQFKKGQSGNRKGRPPGAKNKGPATDKQLADIVRKEAYREVNVKEGDKEVTLTMAELIVRSMATNAGKGDHASQKTFSRMLEVTEAEKNRFKRELFDAAIEYKIYWSNELEYCRKNGLEPPELKLHPDHVHVDLDTLEVSVREPLSPEQQENYWWIRREYKKFSDELRSSRDELRNETDPEVKKMIRNEITFFQRLLNRFEEIQPWLKELRYP